MDSMGRATSGSIWFASEHTHKSANASSEGIPALRSIEAKAWQRVKGADAEELVEAAGGAAAAARVDGLP
jgi:hypothetical protein